MSAPSFAPYVSSPEATYMGVSAEKPPRCMACTYSFHSACRRAHYRACDSTWYDSTTVM